MLYIYVYFFMIIFTHKIMNQMFYSYIVLLEKF